MCWLLGIMAIMAFRATRNIAMLFMMAVLTVLLSMGTRKFIKFVDWPCMTIGAGFAQPIHGRNHQRSMGVLVAVETIDLYRSMLLAVAGGAERHQGVVVVFPRVICMKHFMTLLAGKAVLTAGVFQICKLSGVTLAAFGGLQRSWCRRIKTGIDLWQFTISSKG